MLQRRTAIALGLVPFLALVALHWKLEPPAEAGDYAQYILHAKNLLSGNPYGDTGYLFTPLNWAIGPPVYPPGLPLTIAPLLAMGAGLDALRLVSVVSMVVFLLVAGSYFARRTSPWMAMGGVAMSGVAIESNYASTQLLSDPGFCALLWALIWLVDRERPWNSATVAAVTALGLAAILYRVPGVVLIPALVVWWVIDGRRHGRAPAVTAGLWMVAIAIGALATGALRLLPRASESSNLAALVYRVRGAIGSYRLALSEAQTYPFAGNVPNDIYHALAAVAALVGMVMLVRARPRCFLHICAGIYAAMLAVAPVKDGRYLWPLYPLIAAATLVGVRAILGRANQARWERVVGIAALGVALAAATTATRRPHPPSLLGDRDVQQLFAFAQSVRTTSDVRFQFVNPRVLTLHTDVPAMGTIPADRIEQAIAEYERLRITHVVIGGPGTTPEDSAALAHLVRGNPELFSIVLRTPTLEVHRFRVP